MYSSYNIYYNKYEEEGGEEEECEEVFIIINMRRCK